MALLTEQNLELAIRMSEELEKQNSWLPDDQDSLWQWLEQLQFCPLIKAVENQLEPSLIGGQGRAEILSLFESDSIPSGDFRDCDLILRAYGPSNDILAGKPHVRQLSIGPRSDLYPAWVRQSGFLSEGGVPVGVDSRVKSLDKQTLTGITIGRQWPAIGKEPILEFRPVVEEEVSCLLWDRSLQRPNYRRPTDYERNQLAVGTEGDLVTLSATESFPEARGFRIELPLASISPAWVQDF
jgi:hypothetical protein